MEDGDLGFNRKTKEAIRFILLVVMSIGAYSLLNEAYELEQSTKHLSTQYAGVIGTYLATWGYIIKWFFTAPVEPYDDTRHNRPVLPRDPK